MSQQATQGNSIESGVQKIRDACQKRGATGIRNLGRTFRIMDDDGSRSLNPDEFLKGLHDYGLRGLLSNAEIHALFQHFDQDGSGSVSVDEFLAQVRGPVPQCRMNLIEQAFNKLDADGSGRVTVDEIAKKYNCKHHPKFKSGEMTERECFVDFMKNYQKGGTIDDVITKEEFINYYVGVSNSIDQHVYFDMMMRNAWKL